MLLILFHSKTDNQKAGSEVPEKYKRQKNSFLLLWNFQHKIHNSALDNFAFSCKFPFMRESQKNPVKNVIKEIFVRRRSGMFSFLYSHFSMRKRKSPEVVTVASKTNSESKVRLRCGFSPEKKTFLIYLFSCLQAEEFKRGIL